MSVTPDLPAEFRKLWRLGTAPLRSLPRFIIGGAAKCGTSSLYDLITAHPAVRRASRKEPTNFVHSPGSALRSRMHMPLGRGSFSGEASVEYFMHPDAPRSIRAVIPEVRLIFLLRDPVDRAWSDYQMYVQAGQSPGDFTEITRRAMNWLGDPSLAPLVEAAEVRAVNPVRIVSIGMYARHLRRWFGQFSREQMLFLFSTELEEDPTGTAARVFTHLGLPQTPVTSPARARGGTYSREAPAEAAAALSEFYRSANEELSEMIQRKVPWR